MTEITTFKCRACKSTGLGPPRFIAGGKVERPPLPCIYCEGGEIEREVEDLYDKQGRMSAIALLHQEGGRPDARTLKIKGEIEAQRFEKDWNETSDGLDRSVAALGEQEDRK